MFKKLKESISGVHNEKSNDFVTIDYPQPKETINHPSYTIKISTNTNSKVFVSIDGDWQTCRFADGYWWYDWSNYTPGKHEIMARLINNEGKIIKKSKTRKCIYRI